MDVELAIIGLGYVGKPLADAFGKHFPVIGIDTDTDKIAHLLTDNAIGECMRYQSDYHGLEDVSIFIVTVPTPVDAYNVPDLHYLKDACNSIGAAMQKGALVIFESTVYPGCTEEICVPILESVSGLSLNVGFSVGYSPERINPGDEQHLLRNTTKIISASNPAALDQMAYLYGKIVDVPLYNAPSIQVAEAAKVIENAQRDINISFVNELAIIFDRMGIDTHDVLEAAATKWNFLKFTPGLVGGHCIGVDPYYLAYKSEQLGYVPEVILAGRRVNSSMGHFIAQKVIKLMIAQNINIRNANVLVLGIAFKENWDDVRNSRVVDMYNELLDFGLTVDVYDPIANIKAVKSYYGLSLMPKIKKDFNYDAIILAVGHSVFKDIDLDCLKKDKCVLFDIKAFLSRETVTARL